MGFKLNVLLFLNSYLFMAAEPNLDRMLHNMEENAEDELSFLLSTGVQYFSTAQLRRLRGQWEVKNYYFHRLYKTWTSIGATAPIWLCIWLGLDLLGAPILGLIFLFFFLFSVIAFFIGMLLMRRLFPGKGHLDMIGEMINEELSVRRQRQAHKE